MPVGRERYVTERGDQGNHSDDPTEKVQKPFGRRGAKTGKGKRNCNRENSPLIKRG